MALRSAPLAGYAFGHETAPGWRVAPSRARVLAAFFLIEALLALPTGSATASDGALEINAACASTGCFALDLPGYPVTINASGAYRLTSNLTPPGTASAIVVKADGVSIDLGGFDVAGAYVCNALPCTPGNGHGIESGHRGTRVANGTVRNFSGDGLVLAFAARVENLGVFSVGRREMNLGAGSLFST